LSIRRIGGYKILFESGREGTNGSSELVQSTLDISMRFPQCNSLVLLMLIFLKNKRELVDSETRFLR
jgi:hypothetical protein